MSLSFRRSLLAFSALSFSLSPSLVQAQPRVNNGNSVGRFDGLVTLKGTVSRRIDNNEFDVRVGGATFRVRSSTNVRVQNGDRVTLRGTFRSNEAFTAQTVRIFGANANNHGGYSPNTPSDYQGSVDFPATLTRTVSAREIEVRGDNGRTYRVVSTDNFGYLRVGTRLRVRGESSGASRIINAEILTANQDGDYDNGNYDGENYDNGPENNANIPQITSRSVDFPARIVRLDTLRNEATVRGENGREYVIRGAQVDKFRTGDRVRVRGEANDSIVELDRLDLVN